MYEQFTLKDGRIVTIRRLDIQDYEINDNYEFVHAWIGKISKYLGRDFNPKNLEEDKKFFYNSLANKDANITIGAIHEGKIIATSSLMINHLNEKMRHVGEWGIVVHPDFQNQGLGTKILLLIERIAKDKGLIRLEAEFFEGNTIAEKLYTEKLNYSVEGRRKYKAKLKNGQFVDSILIGKIINNSLKD
ncbi:MAG: GNAT family N-acetyltransferase [Promethearchaeota archaeon]